MLAVRGEGDKLRPRRKKQWRTVLDGETTEASAAGGRAKVVQEDVQTPWDNTAPCVPHVTSVPALKPARCVWTRPSLTTSFSCHHPSLLMFSVRWSFDPQFSIGKRSAGADI